MARRGVFPYHRPMLRRVVPLVAPLVVLAGCPSKEGERKDAQAASNGAVPATGPLANLESTPYMNEVWSAGGQQTAVVYYGQHNVRVSAPCRQGDGQLACDAIRHIRGGAPVEVARSELDGRASAGVKACQKLGHPLVTAMNGNGDEDTFCRFPDGSLLSTGTLEQYGMRITP